MEIPKTHIEAWNHFYSRFKGTAEWHALNDKQRNTLINADRDSRGARMGRDKKPLRLGYARVRALLSLHAPGVYEPIEVRGFIIHE